MKLVTTGHGTYAAYQEHKRRGDDPCRLCRLARNAYTCLYRWRRPWSLDPQRISQKRRELAVSELISRHRAEFTEILFGLEVVEVTTREGVRLVETAGVLHTSRGDVCPLPAPQQ